MTSRTSPRVLKPLSIAAAAVLAITLLSGSPASAATPASGTQQESSSALSYTGSWKSLKSAGSSGGAIRYSSESTSAVRLTFTGNSITWYSWKTPSAGIIDVYVDGALKASVDNYAPKSRTKVRAFTALNLSSGTHTIKLVQSGRANPKSSGRVFHFDSLVAGKSVRAYPASSGTGSVRYASCPAATVNVATSAQLSNALAKARAGTVIRLAPGTYTSANGDYRLKTSGTADKPIWICGPRSAVVRGTSISSGAALRLEGAANVRVAGFTVSRALQGVMVKRGKNVGVADLAVQDIGFEGIHLYANTTDSSVLNNTVARTGVKNVGYGEGIYVGTSQRRWKEVTGGAPDRSDRNTIAGNTITGAGAEAIEAKEGTSNGVIRDNTIKGHAAGSRASAWVLVTGSGWSVVGNTGSGAVTHGYGSMVWKTWGSGNDFRSNHGTVNASGYGVWVHDVKAGVTVACDNWVTGAAKGVTNTFCSP